MGAGEKKEGKIDKIIAKAPHQICPNFTQGLWDYRNIHA
jgi:hypothetical protein